MDQSRNSGTESEAQEKKTDNQTQENGQEEEESVSGMMGSNLSC
jgi:hypothetical protein